MIPRFLAGSVTQFSLFSVEPSSVLVLWMLGLVLSRVAASAAGSCTLDSTCLVGVASTIGCERHDPHNGPHPSHPLDTGPHRWCCHS